MDTQVLPGGERERCGHVYPEGHGRAGERCTLEATSTGYCASHSRSHRDELDAGLQPAAQSQAQPEQVTAQERAQASLSASAAAWLAKPKTQRALQARWDEILATGSDTELIRLVKELTDRVEGRAGEARVEAKPELPADLAELDGMSTEELIALVRD